MPDYLVRYYLSNVLIISCACVLMFFLPAFVPSGELFYFCLKFGTIKS